MEGFRDRISTSPPSSTRIPSLLHRTCTVLPPTGPGRCVVYNWDWDPLARVSTFRNTRTDILVAVSIQDPVPQGCHLSTSSQTDFPFLA